MSGHSGVEGVRLAKRPLGLYYMTAHARKAGTHVSDTKEQRTYLAAVVHPYGPIYIILIFKLNIERRDLTCAW